MRGSPLILLDAGLVIAFAALGRRSHDEGVTLAGVLEVAAPFLIALGVGWLVARAWRTPAALSTGAVVWAVTVVLGLALRNAVFDRGVAVSFMIVATLTLGALLLGWRAAARLSPVRRALPRA
ncbi:MAG: DUF3054 domain-containing protein [Thermoleophilia bacterium]|nr:DUF3054 domain-containing protein [Thermoleophilia bacterium]